MRGAFHFHIDDLSAPHLVLSEVEGHGGYSISIAPHARRLERGSLSDYLDNAAEADRAPPFARTRHPFGGSVGKARTPRIEGLSVSSMTSRSMPMPRPPVGGRPYSRAVT